MLRWLFMYPCTRAVTTGPIRLVPSLVFNFYRSKVGEETREETMFMHMHRELALLALFTLKVYFIPPPFVSVQQTVEKSLFLNYFYKHCMHRVMAPLMAQTAAERVSNGKGTGGKACIGTSHMSSQHSSGVT